VRPVRSINLLEGVKSQAGAAVTVRYAAARTGGEPVPGSAVRQPDDPAARGFRAEYFENTNLAGTPVLIRREDRIDVEPSGSPPPGVTNMHFGIRWTGQLVVPTNGTYHFTFYGDGGFRVFLDGKPLINRWGDGPARAATEAADLEAGKSYHLRVEQFHNWGGGPAEFGWQLPGQDLFAEAVTAAHHADVAVVCVSTRRSEGEGNDRPSLELPEHQDALIRAVAAANPNTVVVLNAGTPVDMKNWLKLAPALIQAWFPGQEGGAALAAILFGEVNPSGKLPDTLAANREDYPDAANFPGKNNEVDYAEGIYVGYRHFDKASIQPLFPFGYGLSYTTFDYQHLRLSQTQLPPDGAVTVSADITNTGKRAGEEVAELYIRALNPKMDKPVRELKGFARVALNPGETKTIQFALTARDLASFDVPGHQWKADAGEYEVEVGASSRDLRLKAPLSLTATYASDVPLSKENYHR